MSTLDSFTLEALKVIVFALGVIAGAVVGGEW